MDNTSALYNNPMSSILSSSSFTDEEVRYKKVGYHILDEIILLIRGFHTKSSSSQAFATHPIPSATSLTGDWCYDKGYQQGNRETGKTADQPEGLEKPSQKSATELGCMR